LSIESKRGEVRRLAVRYRDRQVDAPTYKARKQTPVRRTPSPGRGVLDGHVQGTSARSDELAKDLGIGFLGHDDVESRLSGTESTPDAAPIPTAPELNAFRRNSRLLNLVEEAAAMFKVMRWTLNPRLASPGTSTLHCRSAPPV
jgi:hypothetical protein